MEQEQLQEKKGINGVVYIGGKNISNYTTAVVMQLTQEGLNEVIIKARGKYITRCVDISQIIVNRLLTDKVEISDIKLDSESFINNENREIRVSTMEIRIIKIM